MPAMSSPARPARPSRPARIDGASLLSWARRCVVVLERRREEINDLNVFPVPDADTGSNMAATMAAALKEAEAAAEKAAEAAQKAAEKAGAAAAGPFGATGPPGENDGRRKAGPYPWRRPRRPRHRHPRWPPAARGARAIREPSSRRCCGPWPRPRPPAVSSASTCKRPWTRR